MITRLLSILPMEEINGGERCPTYMYRWTLLRLFGCAAYLHKFVGEDWSLDKHDHPKRFISIGLRGEYTEHTPHPHWGESFERVVFFRAPWVRTFSATHIHRLSGPTPEEPCWTLVLVGPAVREWGFWSAGAWVKWTDYLKSAAASTRRSC
jgi:hypothetical protein